MMTNSGIVVLEYSKRFYVAPMRDPAGVLSVRQPKDLVDFIIYCVNNNRYYERRELALKIAQAIDRRLATQFGVLRVKIRETLELSPKAEPVEPTLDTLDVLYPDVA